MKEIESWVGSVRDKNYKSYDKDLNQEWYSPQMSQIIDYPVAGSIIDQTEEELMKEE